MHYSAPCRTGISIAGILIASLCVCAQGPDAQSKEAQTKELPPGMPPRATPGDYQAHIQAGSVTIAAEFAGHAVPTLQGPLTTEEYVVVETALFGPAGARLPLSVNDFSLRVNAAKKPLASLNFEVILRSLKDPEWQPPPTESTQKSKTSFGGGGENDSNSPPPVVHIPIEVQRAMKLRVQKSTLPEGDRPLPVAGLIYFQYRGKTEHIHSLELIYSGAAGSATLPLQP